MGWDGMGCGLTLLCSSGQLMVVYITDATLLCGTLN
jgi:hypothetical protein